MEKICKNCLLFNPQESVCAVTVIHEGQKYELPVLPGDSCHWDRVDKEIQNEIMSAIATAPDQHLKGNLIDQVDVPVEIKQVRMWSDGQDGHLEMPEDGNFESLWH